MRPGLLGPSAATDLDLAALPMPDATLVADLGLDRLFAAMTAGDPSLDDIVRRTVAVPLRDVEAIRYRQASVADAIASPAVVRELYDLVVEALEAERRIWGGSMRNAELILDRSAQVIGVFLETLRALRRSEADHRAAFPSPGFSAFFELVATRFDDPWLDDVEEHVQRLRRRTLHVSARLGPGNRGTGYILHRSGRVGEGWRDLIGLEERRSTVEVTLRDQNAMHMLADLRSVAIAPTAGVVREAAIRLIAFFRQLRTELGFLVAAANLHAAIVEAGGRTAWPDPVAGDLPAFAATGLYDPGLRLAIDGPVVTNDVDATGRGLIVVTGANGGGKTTLLRAVGIGQVLLQAGLFVTADTFAADLRTDIHTHFTREEDPKMDRGRLHEELVRLGGLIDAASPTSLVLLNESFSTTDEREGAAIGADAVLGLVDAGARVWFVTHNQALASALAAGVSPAPLCLRAARGGSGERPFRIEVGPPLRTSHGMDLYTRIIEHRASASRASASGASTEAR